MSCAAASSNRSVGSSWFLQASDHHTFQTPLRFDQCVICNSHVASEHELAAHMFCHAAGEPSAPSSAGSGACGGCGAASPRQHRTACGCTFDCAACLRQSLRPRAGQPLRLSLDLLHCPQCRHALAVADLDALLGRTYVLGLMSAALHEVADLRKLTDWQCPACQHTQTVHRERAKARKPGLHGAVLALQQRCDQCAAGVCMACLRHVVGDGPVHDKAATACLQSCLLVVERSLALVARGVGVSPDYKPELKVVVAAAADAATSASADAVVWSAGVGYGDSEYRTGSGQVWTPVSEEGSAYFQHDRDCGRKLQMLTRALQLRAAGLGVDAHLAFDYLLASSSWLCPILRSYLANDALDNIVARSVVYLPLLQLLQLLLRSAVVSTALASSPQPGSLPSVVQLVDTLKAKAALVARFRSDSGGGALDGSNDDVQPKDEAAIFQALAALDTGATEAAAAPPSADVDYVRAMLPLQFAEAPLQANHHFAGLIGEASAAVQRSRLRRLSRELDGVVSESFVSSAKTSIVVRVDSSRLDVYRVMITGPRDTPYAFGVFLFDVYLPADYPNSPPKVNGLTNDNGSFGFNPNLYSCGYVCLTLLGTWHGNPDEMWNPAASTLLQVLISIQSFILGTDQPYFNEPGYQTYGDTSASDAANEEYRRGTIRIAINDHLRDPSKYPEFADAIRTHLTACRQDIIDCYADCIDEIEAFKTLLPA